jgi:hypothetical protein
MLRKRVLRVKNDEKRMTLLFAEKRASTFSLRVGKLAIHAAESAGDHVCERLPAATGDL